MAEAYRMRAGWDLAGMMRLWRLETEGYRVNTIASIVVALSSTACLAQEREGIEPVPFTAVRVEDAFWSPRLETNRNVTVWYDFEQCEKTGRIRNFAIAGGLEEGEF